MLKENWHSERAGSVRALRIPLDLVSYVSRFTGRIFFELVITDWNASLRPFFHLKTNTFLVSKASFYQLF